jgi:hypothetical protein
MPAKQIPVLVKHVALAVYKSGDIAGTGATKVQGALNVAVFRLVQYGFLWKNAGKVTPEKIKLTSKGLRAEARHRREKGAKLKTDQWNDLYKLIQEEAEEDVGAGATSQESGSVSEAPHEVRSQQARRRQAKTARTSSPRRKPKRVKRAKNAKRR